MMDTGDQILDIRPDRTQNSEYVVRHLAGGGKRFANFIIDSVISRLLVFAFTRFLLTSYSYGVSWNILWFGNVVLIPVLYYFIMEYTTGKTIGKYITRTKVVTKNGEHPEASNILGRSFARLIPFDAFSFLGGKTIGWHDSLPGTRVIEEA